MVLPWHVFATTNTVSRFFSQALYQRKLEQFGSTVLPSLNLVTAEKKVVDNWQLLFIVICALEATLQISHLAQSSKCDTG